MAALIKHGLSKNNEITIHLLFRKPLNLFSSRSYANKKYKQKLRKVEMPQCRKLKSTEESIATRGFMRAQQSYDPPENVEERLQSIYGEYVGDISKSSSALDSNTKYWLLSACFAEFKYSVPNSILHTINNYNDLLDFYKNPVNTTLPLEKLKLQPELPPNLHIQTEALRFIKEEDTMFGGQTAYPESNTIVTGLRAKRKYKGNQETDIWPINIKSL